MDQKELGDRIKQIRKSKQITQDDLAEAIGRNRTTISNIERGLHYPELATRVEIAKVLKTPIGDIFAYLGERNLKKSRRADLIALNDAGRALDDHHLSIAVDQVKALAKPK